MIITQGHSTKGTGLGPRRLRRGRSQRVRRDATPDHDLTIAGPVVWGDGLGRICPSLYMALYKLVKTKIYHMQINDPNLQSSLPTYIQKHNLLTAESLSNKKQVAKHLIFTGLQDIGSGHQYEFNRYIDAIRLAKDYRGAITMLEGTKIPQSWVRSLNNNFTEALVPAEYLIDIYKSCDVKIPVIHMPLVMIDMSELLSRDSHKHNEEKPFTFGILSGGWTRKMVAETAQVFIKTFPISSHRHLKLRIHCRFGDASEMEKIHRIATTDPRIHYTCGVVNEPDVQIIKDSFDCYLSASCGEGFSFTPREFLARGVPSIISSGHAHTPIIENEGAIGVKISHMRPAFYGYFGHLGEEWVPDMNDLAEKMLDVYNNYDSHCEDVATVRENLAIYGPEILGNKIVQHIFT